MPRFFYYALILLILISIGCLAITVGILYHTQVDVVALVHYDPGTPSVLLDDQGEVWAQFAIDRREPVTIDQVPIHVINAFLAAEDWTFFSHHGISYKGIIRSLFANLYYGRRAQGASTITQQLVKLLFLDSSKTFTRKIKEQCYALVVEYNYTKEQILEMYLNHIYFGCGIYGIKAAARRFWNCSVTELSIEQGAALAAVIRSPGTYCPLLHLSSCQNRRNLILKNMSNLGFIDFDMCAELQSKPLAIIETVDTDFVAPHFKHMIVKQLKSLYGTSVIYKGGLVVQTTLNQAMQKSAQESFDCHIHKIRDLISSQAQGALVSIEACTGKIKALIGGQGLFKLSPFNRAEQAYRQIGSLFKILVYAQAVDSGLTFDMTSVDQPITVKYQTQKWSPRNWDDRFEGQVTLAHALSRSNNIIAVKTFLHVGPRKILQLARDCNLPVPNFAYPSLALGCIDCNLTQVAGMFNVIVNKGIYVKPYSIEWIKDKNGRKIWQVVPECKSILSWKTSSQVGKVLEASIKRIYQAAICKPLPFDVMTKTGTTNQSRTCWYVGANPEITTAVYIGCDNNQSLGENVYPLRTAFPIWYKYYSTLKPVHRVFEYEPSLQTISIDQYTGAKSDDLDFARSITILK